MKSTLRRWIIAAIFVIGGVYFAFDFHREKAAAQAVVGVESYPPLIFRGKDGVEGVSTTILKNIPSDVLQVSWTEERPLRVLLQQLAIGEVDIVTSIAETKERREFALFTKPYFIVGSKLFYVTPNPKTVCVGKDFAIEVWARKHLTDRMQVVTEDTDAECVKRVLTGGADAVALDEISAIISIYPSVMHRFTKEDLDFTYALAYGVNKRKPWLVDLLNKHIDKARSTSE